MLPCSHRCRRLGLLPPTQHLHRPLRRASTRPATRRARRTCRPPAQSSTVAHWQAVASPHRALWSPATVLPRPITNNHDRRARSSTSCWPRKSCTTSSSTTSTPHLRLRTFLHLLFFLPPLPPPPSPPQPPQPQHGAPLGMPSSVTPRRPRCRRPRASPLPPRPPPCPRRRVPTALRRDLQRPSAARQWTRPPRPCPRAPRSASPLAMPTALHKTPASQTRQTCPPSSPRQALPRPP